MRRKCFFRILWHLQPAHGKIQKRKRLNTEVCLRSGFFLRHELPPPPWHGKHLRGNGGKYPGKKLLMWQGSLVSCQTSSQWQDISSCTCPLQLQNMVILDKSDENNANKSIASKAVVLSNFAKPFSTCRIQRESNTHHNQTDAKEAQQVS